MKTVIINGISHKGTTYHIGQSLAQELGGEVITFDLPQDFGFFCTGCGNCIIRSETLCPHHQALLPLLKAMDEPDVLIFTTPTYVMHATGSMKAFLDHFGMRYMVHRPNPLYFKKQAVVISTAAGAGMKSACQDILDSLFYWGVPQRYRLSYAVFALNWDHVSSKKREAIQKDVQKTARLIRKRQGHLHIPLKTKGLFYFMRMIQKKGTMPIDHDYWKEHGWLDHERPWH